MLLSDPCDRALHQYEYLEQELLPNLPALKYLDIRIWAVGDEDCYDEDLDAPLSLHHVGARIRNENLETLIIDLTEVDARCMPIGDMFRSFSLEHLPNLRRLVASQMFYFSLSDMGGDYCTLPASIQSIEVTDFDFALEYFVYYLKNEAVYSRLKPCGRLASSRCRLS